jgi:hypothetical protein
MSECSGNDCDHISHQKEEPKLTDRVLKQPETPPVPQQEDNLVLANRMIAQLLPPFYESLTKLSKKEMAKILKLVVQFPFIDVKKFKLNNKQKVAFMYADRLVYANMVQRARAELERTFGEVQKEITEEAKQEETKEEKENV